MGTKSSALHRPLLLATVTFACTAVYLSLFRHALTDDAFITLQYARTLAYNGTWGLVPGSVSNTATSPFNVALLAAISRFSGDPILSAFILAAACYALILIVLRELSRTALGVGWPGWLAFFALLFNPLLISTIGLESLPQVTLLCLLLLCFQRSHPWATVACCAVLTLIRPDGVVFLLATLIAFPQVRKLRYLALYAAAIAPWFLFSWIYLGSIVPDTLFVKINLPFVVKDGIAYRFPSGLLLYALEKPIAAPASLLFALPVAIFGRALWRDNRRLTDFALLLIVFHFLGYSLLNLPPFHWYYAPEVALTTVVGALAIGTIACRSRMWPVTLAATTAISAGGLFFWCIGNNFRFDQPPMGTNWATETQYAEIGKWIAANFPNTPILFPELGTLSYYCNCRPAGIFADPARVHELLAGRHPGAPPLLLKLDLAWRKWPPPVDPAYRLEDFPARAALCPRGTIKSWHTGTEWRADTKWCFVRVSNRKKPTHRSARDLPTHWPFPASSLGG